MLNPNIGFDLGLNHAGNSGYTYKDSPQDSDFYKSAIKTVKGEMWQLIPSLVFTTKINSFQPYARLGLILGKGTIYEDEHWMTYNNNDPVLSSKSVWKYYGGISIGYNTVLGVSYPLNDKFDVFAEASMNMIYDQPEKGTLVEYEENGLNKLESMSFHDRNMVFKSNASYSYDKAKPTEESLRKFSFNTLVANVGIKMKLL